MQELTNQPYAGVYLFYLMFEEFSDDYEIAEQAFANATKFDFLVHISLMEDSVLEKGLGNYFDINRRMKLAEKFDEDRSNQLFDEVLNVLVQVSEECDARMVLEQDCQVFLQLANSVVDDNSVCELVSRAAEIKQSDEFDILNQILAIKTRKNGKNGGIAGGIMSDRSMRSGRNGQDFKWQDIQRVLTK